MEDHEPISIKTHKKIAIELNGRVWKLLGKTERTNEENSEMLHAAHGSAYHWLQVGKTVKNQRAEWLIAYANAQLGYKVAAMRHAKTCLEMTLKHPKEMKAFDLAYAQEAMARAHAIYGNRLEAETFYEKAQRAGNLIDDVNDKEIFESDLRSGNWGGMKWEENE